MASSIFLACGFVKFTPCCLDLSIMISWRVLFRALQAGPTPPPASSSLAWLSVCGNGATYRGHFSPFPLAGNSEVAVLSVVCLVRLPNSRTRLASCFWFGLVWFSWILRSTPPPSLTHLPLFRWPNRTFDVGGLPLPCLRPLRPVFCLSFTYLCALRDSGSNFPVRALCCSI